MATALIPNYSSISTADSAATAGAIMLRDASADSAARRLTLSRLIRTGGLNLTASTKTTTYTATADDGLLLCDATGGAFTVALPTVASSAGMTITIMRTSASNNVVVDGAGSETINGATTKTITTQYGLVELFCTGSEWLILGQLGTIT